MVLAQIIITFLAVITTGISTFPQFLKTARKRKAENISLFTFWLLWISSFSWICYSVFQSSVFLGVLIANLMDFIILNLTLILFFKFSNNKRYKYVLFSNSFFIIFSIVTVPVLLYLNLKIDFSKIMKIVFINLAAFCLFCAYFPQIYKILKYKKSSSISIFYRLNVLFLTISWIAYYSLAGNMPQEILNQYPNSTIIFSITKVEMVNLIIWESLALFVNIILIISIIRWMKH